MKRKDTAPSKGFLIFYRIVIAVFLALIVLLAAGSLYAIIRPPGSGPLFRLGGHGAQGGVQSSRTDSAVAVFSGIGRLRIPVAGQPPATVILSISFPYPIDDGPFTEELASRIGEFRSIATGYFSSLSIEQITRLDEEAAKAEILKRYNALLRLGRIETLFFSDLMVIE